MVTTRHTPHSWRSRIRGCLLAGALGDAVGRPFEGHTHVSLVDVEDVLQGGGPLRWTDDTALLLALAEYLGELDDVTAINDDDLARRFALAWQADPHRGYGSNPPQIFATVLSGGDWRSAATRSFGGAGSLGNGGAMRAAPVGALPATAALVAHLARRTAAVTHAHRDAQDAAAAVALATWVCLRTEPDDLDPAALLSTITAELSSSTLIAATQAVVDTIDLDDPAAVAEVTGTGIAAVEAAPAALAAFLHHPQDPVAVITFAVAMGGDTDTVATMAGCLSGALTGQAALPESLLTRLEQARRIGRIADALAARTHPHPEAAEDKDAERTA